MYYEFINEHRIKKYDKPYANVEGRQISYPSVEVLLMAGIKPLVVEDIPAHDMETQYVEAYYEDGETAITQKWRVLDIPQEVIEDESVGNS